MRKLQPATIIPPSMYVERAADRQLERVVTEMGRPAYVLVARQMGKTNLLINMKRRREAAGDLVVYHDLSTRNEDLRSLFRQIIDSISGSSNESFSKAKKELEQNRPAEQRPANSEYDYNLRHLLRATDKNVVIILDEVDSLTSVSYSDAFFSQIRSMYFSRINYPEYERLTYVLSGVADPSDLIRDKSISPFNIGEKIYLDDFDRREFNQFQHLAGLNIPSDASEEIYRWTQGNPRMTWDICSEVELAIEANQAITKTEIRSIVDRLYLARFDRAPVDHMRVLAENDPHIRSALISLRWGKGDTLDEKTKNRLYLAGIVGASPTTSLRVKNPIIDAALSDKWIAQVAAASRNLLDFAADHFAASRYGEAVGLITQFVKDGGADLPLSSRVHLGISLYFLGRYQDALSELELTLGSDLTEEARATCEYYIGSSLLRSARIDDSIVHLKAAARTGSLASPARLALGTALLIKDAKANRDEIISLNEQILKTTDDKEANDRELRAAANFNIAQVSEQVGDLEAAALFLRSALDLAPPVQQPTILLRQLRLASPEQRRRLAAQAAEIIVSNRLTLGEEPVSALRFGETTLATLFCRLYETEQVSEVRTLAKYSAENLYDKPTSIAALLMRLFVQAEKERASFVALPKMVVEMFFDDANLDDQSAALRAIVRHSPPQIADATFIRYSQTLKQRRAANQKLLEDDFVLVIDRIFKYVQAAKFAQALDLIETVKVAVDEDDIGGIVISYNEFLARRGLKDLRGAREAAEEAVGLIDQYGQTSGDLRSVLQRYRADAHSFLAVNDPYRKLGRNDKITVREKITGKVSVVKFKQVESRLRSGQFEIADEEID